MFADVQQVEVAVRTNEVIQSPDVQTTILESIKVKEDESKLHSKVHVNEMNLKADEETREKLKKVKLSMWKVILLMWYFQCLFMSANCNKKDKRAWKIRKLAVKTHLKLTGKEKAQWADHELFAIYFSEVE